MCPSFGLALALLLGSTTPQPDDFQLASGLLRKGATPDGLAIARRSLDAPHKSDWNGVNPDHLQALVNQLATLPIVEDSADLAARGSVILSSLKGPSWTRDFLLQINEKQPNAAVTYCLGILAYGRHDLTAARDWLEKAETLDSQFSGAPFRLGLLLAEIPEQHVQAVESFDRTLQLAPDHAEARRFRATLLLQLGRHVEAEAEFRKIITHPVSGTNASMSLASLLAQQGRLGEALDIFEATAKENPQNARAFFNWGYLLFQMGRVDSAREVLTIAETLNPDHARVHLLMGRLDEDRGDTASASVRYERALQLDPALADARYRLEHLGSDPSPGSTTPPPSGKTPDIRFEERSDSSGIEFVDHHGRTGAKEDLREIMGGGVALLDYDTDGDLDVLLVDGDPRDGSGPAPTRLYANLGNFLFEDVTEKAKLDLRCDGSGVATGDVNNDGRDDIYVVANGPNALLLNQEDNTFLNITESAGVGDPEFGTSAAFADFDADGDLDLYVGNYVTWTDETKEAVIEGGMFRGFPVLAGPRGMTRSHDLLYKNMYRETGKVTFVDHSQNAGISAHNTYTLGVIAFDADQDGDMDLYVANDSEANLLYLNDGDMTFKESGMASGTAYDEMGRPQAGMGLDAGDTDGNGLADLFVTNFSHDFNTIYRNEGQGSFQDSTRMAGISESTFLPLGFGCTLIDADLDGDLDLGIANGHVFPNIQSHPVESTFAQANQFLANDGSGKYFACSSFPKTSVHRVSRGLARGDLDGDGREDLVITNLNDRPTLLRNATSPGNQLVVTLVGVTSNRNGVGAKLTATLPNGNSIFREVTGGGSYLSSSARDIVFGLGDQNKVSSLLIRWPSGVEQTFRDINSSGKIQLTESREQFLRSDL